MGSVKKTMLFVIMVCSIIQTLAQNDSVFNGEKLSSFRLFDVAADKTIHLTTPGSNTHLSLFIFLSPECPLSQSYLPLLNSLKKTYAEAISFYGIIPGRAYSKKTVSEFGRAYKIQFPLLIDSLKSLTGYMYASVTPEVILLDNKSKLVYKGAVDDLVSTLGKRKLKATNDYLKNAIDQSLGNMTVVVRRTKAVGCKINDY